MKILISPRLWIIFTLSLLFTTSSFCQSSVTRAISSGDWDAPSTWDNGVPTASKRAIITKDIQVNIVGFHRAKEVIVHGVLNVNENGRRRKSLRSRWVHVNSGGIFRIGTSNNRFDRGTFTLALLGINPNSNQSVPMANGMNMTIENNDGFLMAGGGGRLQFFGEDKLPFTKLSETANIGANTITVANVIDRNHSGSLSPRHDGVLNWEVGDQIVIASSATNYSHEDVRTITRIQDLGTNSRITLDSPLTYMHYGEIETYGNNLDSQSINPGKTFSIDMRAEVALLSRNIIIKGREAQDTDTFFGDRAKLEVENGKAKNGIGGHIMIMPTAGQISVEGVQLDLMGQAGRLGRYPFHWHIARDRSGDYIKNSSITNSNNRGVVVHTTDNVLVEGVVLHDVHGHGFFTEDGVELNNKFINNIAFGIHRVHSDNNRSSGAFVVDETDRFEDRGDRARTTAAFWIANAGNDYIGNVVAGCEGSGIWFGQPALPRGASRSITEYANFKPRETPLADFDHNTVHSSRTGFVVALRGNAPGGGGAFRERERTFGNVNPVYKNLTIYLTRIGLYPLVSNVRHIFPNFKAADNNFFSWDSDPNLIKDALLVVRSRGNLNERKGNEVTGLALYHGNTIIENAHIAGVTGRFFVPQGGGNRIRSGAETQGLSYENDGSYSNMSKTQRSNHSEVRDVYDRDGTLTGRFGGGPGYSFAPLDSWTFDSSAGDKRTGSSTDRFRSIITKKRYINLETPTSSSPALENKTPKMTITSPLGVTRSFEKRDRFNQRRIVLWAEEEYTVEFPDGFDTDVNELRLSAHQWSMPSNTLGVILKFVNQADNIKPQNLRSKLDANEVSTLNALKGAKEDSYYRANNNDLYIKIMNRGSGIHSNWVHFVKAGANNNGVTVYEHCNQTGRSATFNEGVYNARDFRNLFPNNSISSIRVPDGFLVTLYNGDLSGSTLTLTSSDGCLANNGFNDKTSSIHIGRSKYRFDFGTENSPLQTGYERVTNTNDSKAYKWNNTSGIGMRDRGIVASGVNSRNRDLIFSAENRIFNVEVPNARYRVFVVFGDAAFPHDRQEIKAENGQKFTSQITTKAGEFNQQVLDLDVSDRELSLEFRDRGGVRPNWAVSSVRFDFLSPLRNSSKETQVSKLIGDDSLADNIVIYPNPVSEILTVDLPLTTGKVATKYTIMNIEGRQVDAGIFFKEQPAKLDVSRLSKGMYVIKVVVNKNIYIEKFIVE